MKDTTYNGAFMRTTMTKTLTLEDIRDLLTGFVAGFVAAIELDQIRVDALPPEKFHRWYSDSMWRDWRRLHIDYSTAVTRTNQRVRPASPLIKPQVPTMLA